MFSQTAQAEFHETSDSDSQAEDREYFNETLFNVKFDPAKVLINGSDHQ